MARATSAWLQADSLRGPSKADFATMVSAVSKVEVDKRLVRQAALLRHPLEVLNRVRIQSNGDLRLERTGVWIALG